MHFIDNIVNHKIFVLLNQSNYTGLTGIIEFDTKGIRSNVEIDIMSLDAKGLKQIGSFKPTRKQRLNILAVEEDFVDTTDLPLDQMTFTVITALVS